jgi:hypothetical protein
MTKPSSGRQVGLGQPDWATYIQEMSHTRTIEIDTSTADELEARAAMRGVSIREMVAELVATDETALQASADDVAELDRQWAAIESESATVPHDQVARWLETWGTPTFKPWRDQ